jgi:hypothetical protein
MSRPRAQADALWAAIAGYAIVQVGTLHTSMLTR